MTTRFTPGSAIRREIAIGHLTKPVQVEITAAGIKFWIKGSRKGVTTSWLQTVQAGTTGQDVPSYLAGRPLELLEHFTHKRKEERDH